MTEHGRDARQSHAAAKASRGRHAIGWSLDRSKGRRAVDGNRVVARHGRRTLPDAVPIGLKPKRFPP